MGAIVTVDHILSPTNAIFPMRFDHATTLVFIFIEILCHILQVKIYKAYDNFI